MLFLKFNLKYFNIFKKIGVFFKKVYFTSNIIETPKKTK